MCSSLAWCPSGLSGSTGANQAAVAGVEEKAGRRTTGPALCNGPTGGVQSQELVGEVLQDVWSTHRKLSTSRLQATRVAYVVGGGGGGRQDSRDRSHACEGIHD